MAFVSENPKLQQTTVEAAISRHWPGFSVVKLLKESQNYTYEGRVGKQGEEKKERDEESHHSKCAIRAVPIPKTKTPEEVESTLNRLNSELQLLHYLQHFSKVLPSSYPVPPTVDGFKVKASEGAKEADGAAVPPLFAYDPDLEIATVVLTWAEGKPVDLSNQDWLCDLKLIRSQGAWLGQLHKISQSLPPHIQALRYQHYTELHDHVMKGCPIDPADEALMRDPKAFGLTHGDFNVSNFFINGVSSTDPNVYDLVGFDWDQAQMAWYMYDVAQASNAVIMLQEANPDQPHKQDIPEAIDAIVDGYESVMGKGTVDRDHLDRMIELRRQFYIRFANRELIECKLPPGMHAFCQFVAKYGEITNAKPTVLRRPRKAAE
jgi:hypothetical protein